MFKISRLTYAETTYVHRGQYYVARRWSGNDVLGADTSTNITYIAKPWHLRQTISTEIVDQTTVTYAASATDPENRRTATAGTETEKQVIYPRYIARTVGASPSLVTDWQSIVYAVRVTGGTGVSHGIVGQPQSTWQAVEWMEVLPARVWARENVQ
jgi:hypothetical protein